MPDSIENSVRDLVGLILQDSIETVLDAYLAYLHQPPPEKKSEKETGPDHKAHHATARCILAHLQTLLRLARWADECPGQGQGADKNPSGPDPLALAALEIQALRAMPGVPVIENV